jgi:hypothetical protein
MKKKLKLFCLMAFILSSIISAYSVHQVTHEKRLKEQQALDVMTELARVQASELSKKLIAIQPLVSSLADDIYLSNLGIDEIEKRLQHDLKENEWMFGFGVAFEPYRLNDEQRLWSRYYTSVDDGVIKAAVIDYDYTLFEHTWYRKPILHGKLWNEPYIGDASQTLLIEFGEPFWLPGKNRELDDPDGLIFGSLSIEKMKKIIQFDHDLISYYQVISKQGQIVVHPTENEVLSGKTIFEQAWQHDDAALNSMAIHAVAGDSGYIDHLDPATKTGSWMIYQPIAGPNWSLIVVVNRDRLLIQDDMRQHWYVVILQLLVSVILLVAFSVLQWSTPPHPHLLLVSMVVSAIVFYGGVCLWKINDKYRARLHSDELRLVNKNVLDSFRNEQLSLSKDSYINEPRFVETGTYLQSLEFEGANNVKVSGYIWQRYKKGVHKGLSRGFVLPEAGTPHIEEVYREFSNPNDLGCQQELASARDCEELIGWYVSASMRQEFDYSFYPLDTQQVWIRMWHQAFRDNVILVPDLTSYARLNPKSIPGIQHGFVLPGWNIQESWFSINMQKFNTNFGLLGKHKIQQKPELFFNVTIQREFINPFVSRIIPVVVISVLMFLIVLISTKSGEAASWLGFTANDVVVGLSALFFVIGLSHTDLRQSLSSPKIMYFEYIYFVIYSMLLYVAVSSIYIAKQDQVDNLDENFLSKNFYWPVLSGTFFMVTFWVFY